MACVSVSSEPAGMVIVALICSEDIDGMKIMPFATVAAIDTTSSTVTASSVTARCDRHQRSTFSYPRRKPSNRACVTTFSFFISVALIAGTTVSATINDADSE